MKKAAAPFVHPSTMRIVSREGWVCLVLVLAVHLLLAGWVGWSGTDEKPVMAAPVAGWLVSGHGASGGNAGESSPKGNGPEAKGRKKAALPDSGTQTGKPERPDEKNRVKRSFREQPEHPVSTDGRSAPAAVYPEARQAKGADPGFLSDSENGTDGAGTGPFADGAGDGGNGNEGGHDGGGSGGVAGPYADAGFFSNPKPPYPAVSRRMGEEGVVVLALTVLEDGRVTDVKVKRSSGFPRLDESALKTVRRWRYVPAKRNGRPIAFRYVQPVRFSLND